MKSILVFFVVLAVAYAGTIQRTQRDAPQPAQETSAFENLLASFQNIRENVKTSIDKATAEVGFQFFICKLSNFFLFNLKRRFLNDSSKYFEFIKICDLNTLLFQE